jgi:hypothetical protein
MHCLRLASLLVLACLVAACGPSFTYNHLDRLIPWYVDGYVDLSHDQREILRGQLEPLLQWHREEELVRYVAIIDRIGGDLSRPVTAADVQGWIEAVVAAAERTEESMLALAVEFGATLSDAQMAEFSAGLWKRQRDYEEEFLGRSDEQYRQDSYEALAGLLQRFAGRLEPAQEQRLQAAVAELVRFDRAWLEDRAHWLRQLEPLLQREPGWQQAVQSAFLARRDNRLPDYRVSLRHNLDAIEPALADALNQMSDRQRARMARELGELRRRLVQLSGSARAA